MTSERLRKAKKNKSRNNMRCEVEKFVRGSEINIIEWIVQMETYFGISSLKPRDYVGFMLQKIAQPYFKEMSPFKDLAYFDFREKLIEVFGEPDMATARIHELRRAEQQYGEPISEYMNRLRLLVMRAHPELSHKERERILVPSFILGLRDHELSTSLTMASVTSSAEAERRATEGESARRNARSKRSYSNYLPEPSEVPNETAGVPETCEEPSEDSLRRFRSTAREPRRTILQRSRTQWASARRIRSRKVLQLRRDGTLQSRMSASAGPLNFSAAEARPVSMFDLSWASPDSILSAIQRTPSRLGELRLHKWSPAEGSRGCESVDIGTCTTFDDGISTADRAFTRDCGATAEYAVVNDVVLR